MLRTLLMVLIIPALAVAVDPVVGTWKLNVAKSKFNPGPAPKSSTVTYTEEGEWISFKSETVNADGSRTTRSNRYKLDGKEHPYTSPYGKGTISATRNSERQSTSTLRLEGGRTVTQKFIVSADGKTRTVITTGANTQGQLMNNNIVYDRQ